MKIIFLMLIFICACGIEIYSRELPTTGYATYYTIKSCQAEGTSGILTASGKKYDESAMTCALPFHPPKVNGKRQWGQKYILTNLLNGRKIIVQHWDFGPGKRAQSKNVVIDLTPAAFLALGGNLRDGKIKVRIEKL